MPGRLTARPPRGAPENEVRTLVPPGMVRMAPTMALPSLLREHDVDPVPLIAEFGLTLAHFDEPERLLPYEGRSRLLVRCAEATRCAHFGLLVGQRAGLSSFGLVGFLAQSAPSIRAAVELALRYFQLHNPNATIGFVEQDGFAHFGHTILRPDFPGREQVVDMSAAIMFNTLRLMCGQGVQPIEVRLARGRPADTAPYQRFFQAPLVFNASDTGLVAASAWLDRPVPTSDPLLHRMMRERVTELESRAGDDVVSRLRRQLPSLLAARTATIAAVAQGLGLPVRTLNRRLAERGTSFARLRDEARHAMAQQLLRGTAMPVGEIAEQLGYAHASAFTSAFRRWSGQGPSQWRHAKGRASSRRAGRK